MASRPAVARADTRQHVHQIQVSGVVASEVIIELELPVVVARIPELCPTTPE
jgi:hypothetical protein